MYIENYLPAYADVLAAVKASPKMKLSNREDDQNTYRVLTDTIMALTQRSLSDEIVTDLSDAVAMYEVNNGQYSDIPPGDEGARKRDDYESGMDDLVETFFAPFDAYLSANWLGVNTIDTRLWEKGALEALATSAAKEIWREMTHEKSPAQMLANAGFPVSKVEQLMQDIRKGDTAVNEPASTSQSDAYAATLFKIKSHIGDGFDVVSVYEDLETIFNEEDEILVNSSASRLGIVGGDVSVLQIASIAFEDPADDVCKALVSLKLNEKPTRSRKASTPAVAAGEAPHGTVSESVLLALKNNGAGDTAMAEKMGVSRTTYTGWCKGSQPFVPTEAQHSTVRAELVQRFNDLGTALAALDGSAYEPVR